MQKILALKILNRDGFQLVTRSGVAVSFSPSQYDKTHDGLVVADDLPEFLTAVPTKASHTVTLGLELVNNLLDQSLQRNAIAKVS